MRLQVTLSVNESERRGTTWMHVLSFDDIFSATSETVLLKELNGQFDT